MHKKACVILFLVLAISNVIYAQVTTAGLKGYVTGIDKENLSGATVIATHQLTGERYSTTTLDYGAYVLPNLKPGGPYTIQISFAGYRTETITDLQIPLGEYIITNAALEVQGENLSEVVVTADANSIFDKKNKGTATNINREQLSSLPTINRSLQDFTRLSPNANGNSFAGSNYRYNNLSIDGAALNDAFGFTEPASGAPGSQATGTPGSLAKSQPISLEAIDEVQVSVSPFVVTAGNFTGGSINAVTKSGTNVLAGSVFFSGRNQTTTGPSADAKRQQIENYSDYQTGFGLGGAIKKNTLFYFVSAEIGRKTEPVLFAPGTEGAAIPANLAQAIADTLRSRYGYESGSFGKINIQANSNKYFGRLDWNISDKHKLQLRNNYVGAFGDYLERGANSLNFESQGYRHISKTNSTVLELKSNFNSRLSNNLIVGYTTVNDKRDINGEIFPHLEITFNTANVIFAGAYREAAIYGLGIKTTELTDNLTFYRNKHTITVGTHNEFYNIDYKFLTAWNGRWAYSSPANFFADRPSRIRGVYNLENNDYNFNRNNSSAKFDVYLLSQYIQDEFAINKNLNITYGLRADFAVQPDVTAPSPKVNANPAFSQYQNKVSQSARIAPRLGFNWQVPGDIKMQVRGGAGIFNGRMPFNWLAYPYYNDGIRYGNVDFRPASGTVLPLENDLSKIAAQFQNGITEINLIDNNFKLPQVFRSSLAVDYKTNNNWTITLEGVFTKTMQDVLYKTINLKDSTSMLSGSGDTRTVYLGSGNQQKIETGFTNVFLLTNTSKGYKYQLSASVNKAFSRLFQLTGSYTYGVSKDLANGARNSPQANWEFNQTILPNDPKLAFSNSDLRHRLFIYANKKVNWKKSQTSLSLVYSMQSGSPYSYVYIGDINRDGSGNNDLVYVPTSAGDANLVDIRDAAGNVTVTAAQQWENLSEYISNDKYLRERIGKYAERNGARTPWNNSLDMKLSHSFKLKENSAQALSFSLDVFNLSNLISRKWGRQYFVPNLLNGNYQLLTLQNITNATKPNLQFNDPVSNPWQIDPIASRAQGQLTVRYTF